MLATAAQAASAGACGTGSVCDGGVAGCFARGVCGGVAGGPSCFSSTISAMVVESKPDVEQPTAPFSFRYVNFEPYPFGVSRCSRPLSTAHCRNASLALGARLSCSHVLFFGLRPFPSLLLPTVLGCLAPLALVARSLTREAAASTTAHNGGISVGASGVGDVGDGGASGVGGRMRHWQRMRRRRRRLLCSRRMWRRCWRPKLLLIYD